MKNCWGTSAILCALIAIAWVNVTHAAVMNVSMSIAVGPNISGVVDTTANKFTITSWTNNGSPHTWTPMSNALPIVLTAQTTAGAAYDVPDNFTGSVGSSAGFGFFLPIGTYSDSIAWNQGTPLIAQTSFGWGGFRSTPTFYALEDANTVGYIPSSDAGGRFFLDVPLTIAVTPAPEPSLAAIAGCLLLKIARGSRRG